jgi:hypothetical protein
MDLHAVRWTRPETRPPVHRFDFHSIAYVESNVNGRGSLIMRAREAKFYFAQICGRHQKESHLLRARQQSLTRAHAGRHDIGQQPCSLVARFWPECDGNRGDLRVPRAIRFYARGRERSEDARGRCHSAGFAVRRYPFRGTFGIRILSVFTLVLDGIMGYVLGTARLRVSSVRPDINRACDPCCHSRSSNLTQACASRVPALDCSPTWGIVRSFVRSFVSSYYRTYNRNFLGRLFAAQRCRC